MIIQKKINVEYFWVDNSTDLFVLDTDDRGCLISKYVYKNYISKDKYDSLSNEEKNNVFKTGKYEVIYNDEDDKEFEPVPIISFKMI